MVKDSNDFERKIFSSTPDTSMFFTPGVADSNTLLLDDDFLEDGELDENDQQEVLIQLENSPKRSKSKKNKFKIRVANSSDVNTEKDEDTLSDMTDLVN